MSETDSLSNLSAVLSLSREMEKPQPLDCQVEAAGIEPESAPVVRSQSKFRCSTEDRLNCFHLRVREEMPIPPPLLLSLVPNPLVNESLINPS